MGLVLARENQPVLNGRKKGSFVSGFQEMSLERGQGPGPGRDLGVYLMSKGQLLRRSNCSRREWLCLDTGLVS